MPLDLGDHPTRLAPACRRVWRIELVQRRATAIAVTLAENANKVCAHQGIEVGFFLVGHVISSSFSGSPRKCRGRTGLHRFQWWGTGTDTISIGPPRSTWASQRLASSR